MIRTIKISPWVSIPSPNPAARIRLVCFPYAGGAASIFHSWPSQLPEEVEVWAVELPGRGSRIGEPAFTSMAPLIEAAARFLAPYLDPPFVFFGHSMGAMIAFELARKLRDDYGFEPSRLLVSGRRAPHIPDLDRPCYDLPQPELIQKLRRMKGTPQELLEDPEMMDLLIPILRADFSICQTHRYQPGERLPVPIAAFGGIEDDEETPDLLEEWARHTTQEFSLRLLPGNHFFLHSSQRLLMAMLSEELRQVLRDTLSENSLASFAGTA